MQIVNEYKKEETKPKIMLGYFGNLRLLGYEKLEDENNELWTAILMYDGKLERKLLKFEKRYDAYLPYKTIQIIVENTSCGDIYITDFKPLLNHSMLETLPQELLKFIKNI